MAVVLLSAYYSPELQNVWTGAPTIGDIFGTTSFVRTSATTPLKYTLEQLLNPTPGGVWEEIPPGSGLWRLTVPDNFGIKEIVLDQAGGNLQSSVLLADELKAIYGLTYFNISRVRLSIASTIQLSPITVPAITDNAAIIPGSVTDNIITTIYNASTAGGGAAVALGTTFVYGASSGADLYNGYYPSTYYLRSNQTNTAVAHLTGSTSKNWKLFPKQFNLASIPDSPTPTPTATTPTPASTASRAPRRTSSSSSCCSTRGAWRATLRATAAT